jgi:alpha-amylase
MRLFLKNYRRSDDVAFRFQLKGWEGYPVTAEKYANWIKDEPGYIINLCMDYETIGEHHKKDSGIFEFYKKLPEELAKVGIDFILPSEAVQSFKPEEKLNFPMIVSWADQERDLSAWTGNDMQKNTLNAVYEIRELVDKRLKELDSQEEKDKLLHTWGKLQTSDHFYYMSTKYWSDGDVHKHFSPYNSPYEAFMNFMNVLRDFKVSHLDG